MLAEEGEDMVLKAVGDRAGVGSGIDLKPVPDPVPVENLVKLLGIEPQVILIAHVHRNTAVPSQVVDVLIDKGQRRIGGPFGQNLRLGHAVLYREVEIQRWILRVGRPGRRGSQLRPGEKLKFRGVGGRFEAGYSFFEGLVTSRIRRSGRPRRHAARAHDVQASEHVRVFHADARRAVSTHGVAHKTSARTLGYGPIVAVDPGYYIVRNKLLEIACRNGAGIHRAAIACFRIGQHHDHLLRAGGESAFDRLWDVNFVTPLLRANGIAVQGVNHRVAPMRIGLVPRREENDHVAVGGFTFEITLERSAVNANMLNEHWPGAGHYGTRLGLHLCREGRAQSSGEDHERRRGADYRRHLSSSNLLRREQAKRPWRVRQNYLAGGSTQDCQFLLDCAPELAPSGARLCAGFCIPRLLRAGVNVTPVKMPERYIENPCSPD